jgi:hypothetical protein
MRRTPGEDSGGNSTLVLDRVSFVSLHPDGDTIAFPRDGKLFIGSLKGGDPKPLDAPPFPNNDVGGGDLSPDGTKLMVGVARASPALWLIPFPSGTPHKLETEPSGCCMWFPDSMHVLTNRISGRNSMTLERLNVLDLKREVFFNSPVIMSRGSPREARLSRENPWAAAIQRFGRRTPTVRCGNSIPSGSSTLGEMLRSF